ncbi:MAG: biotin--[acetyl-CoA-carboxylase] ligase [Lysobacterales bacterium]
MSVDAMLMAVLSDGNVHSGATLAQRFGITRAAVWKRVARLRTQGVAIAAVAGSGYRLVQPWQALDRERILEHLRPGTRELLGQLRLVASTGSTSDDLRAAATTLPDLSVLIAEHQSKGRGRRGRSWVSPRGAGLWFSILSKHEGGVGAMAGLSLAIAVLVAEALERLGASRIELKWPNDLWHEGRKLAGILIELAGDWHGPSTAVIGIGINVALADASKASMGQPATDLSGAMGTPPDRNRVMAALLDALLSGMAEFRQYGFQSFHERWDARDALRGRDVFVTGSENASGRAGGIDHEGRLRVLTPRGSILVSAGEVSVRTGAGVHATEPADAV